MRTSSKIFIGIFALLVTLTIGAYCLAWFFIAKQIDVALSELKTGKTAPAELLFDHEVSGFPFAFDVTLRDMRLTPQENHCETLEALELPAANMNYDHIQFNGAFSFHLPVFGKSVQLAMPSEWNTETAGGTLAVTFPQAPQLEVGYDHFNIQLFTYALGLKQKPKAANVLKHLRSITYSDAGMQLATPLGEHSKSYERLAFDLKLDMQDQAAKIDLLLNFDNSRTIPGFYNWYYSTVDTLTFADPLQRELGIYAADYPIYDGPLSVASDVSLTIPRNKPYTAELPARIDLRQLTMTDARGATSHKADLSMYKADDKPQFKGYYTLRMEAFEAMLDNQLELWKGIVDILRSHQESLNAKTAGKFTLPDAVWVEELRPLIKTQIMDYMKAIGALEGDILHLRFIAEENAEPTLNDAPATLRVQSAFQYLQPVLVKMQELDPKAKPEPQP